MLPFPDLKGDAVGQGEPHDDVAHQEDEPGDAHVHPLPEADLDQDLNPDKRQIKEEHREPGVGSGGGDRRLRHFFSWVFDAFFVPVLFFFSFDSLGSFPVSRIRRTRSQASAMLGTVVAYE